MKYPLSFIDLPADDGGFLVFPGMPSVILRDMGVCIRSQAVLDRNVTIEGMVLVCGYGGQGKEIVFIATSLGD